jgi:hypothetical protein
LRSRSRASPSTWSNGGGQPSQGWRTFVTRHRTSPPWTCSLFQRLVSTCSMPSSSSGSTAGTSSRSTSQHIRRPNGLHVKSRKHFPWMEAPPYLIRDRDRIYGSVVTRRLRAMGIRDKPTVRASPWQNGFAERLIGSIRRECVDHITVFSEAAPVSKNPTPIIITPSERIGLCIRMRRFPVRFIRPESFVHTDPRRTSPPLRPSLCFRYTHTVQRNGLRSYFGCV